MFHGGVAEGSMALRGGISSRICVGLFKRPRSCVEGRRRTGVTSTYQGRSGKDHSPGQAGTHRGDTSGITPVYWRSRTVSPIDSRSGTDLGACDPVQHRIYGGTKVKAVLVARKACYSPPRMLHATQRRCHTRSCPSRSRTARTAGAVWRMCTIQSFRRQ